MKSKTRVMTTPHHRPTLSLTLPLTYCRLKRGLDLLASVMALVVLAVPFAVVALLIKLDDPKGRVFYSQMRVGKDGRHFRIWKFRSMVHNADQLKAQLAAHNDVAGAMFKMKNDPRVTRVGRVLRRFSIDELPQLFNIVKGDMSLVGPRPPLPSEVATYTPHDLQRLVVVPGATGLWQVSGRSDLHFDEMVALDLKYINAACFWLDLKIILKTFGVLLRPSGAY